MESSRIKILHRIAEIAKLRPTILVEQSYNNDEIYKPILPDAVSCFKNELETISGKCIICKNEADVYIQLKNYLVQSDCKKPIFCKDYAIAAKLTENGIPSTKNVTDFEAMQTGITSCEFLVARTGSVVVSSGGFSGRQMYVFPPVHIVLASANQLVNYPEDALVELQSKYGTNLPSAITTITGPSRTADIEKTLVLGAHGPKEFIVFLSIT